MCVRVPVLGAVCVCLCARVCLGGMCVPLLCLCDSRVCMFCGVYLCVHLECVSYLVCVCVLSCVCPYLVCVCESCIISVCLYTVLPGTCNIIPGTYSVSCVWAAYVWASCLCVLRVYILVCTYIRSLIVCERLCVAYIACVRLQYLGLGVCFCLVGVYIFIFMYIFYAFIFFVCFRPFSPFRSRTRGTILLCILLC